MSDNAPLSNEDIQTISDMKFTYEQILGLAVGLSVFFVLIISGAVLAYFCFIKKKKSLETDDATYVAYNTTTLAKGLQEKQSLTNQWRLINQTLKERQSKGGISTLAQLQAYANRKGFDENNNSSIQSSENSVQFVNEINNSSRIRQNVNTALAEFLKKRMSQDIEENKIQMKTRTAKPAIPNMYVSPVVIVNKDMDISARKSSSNSSSDSASSVFSENKEKEDSEFNALFATCTDDLSGLASSFDDLAKSNMSDSDLEEVDLNSTGSPTKPANQPVIHLETEQEVKESNNTNVKKNICNLNSSFDRRESFYIPCDDVVHQEPKSSFDDNIKGIEKVSIHDENEKSPGYFQPNAIADINTATNHEMDEVSSVTTEIKLSNENAGEDTAVGNLSNENAGMETAANEKLNENAGTKTADDMSNEKAGEKTTENNLSNQSKILTSFVKIQTNDSTCSMLSEQGSEFEFDEELTGDLLMNPKGIIPAFKNNSLANMMEWDSTYEDIKTQENSLRLQRTPAAERSTRSFLRGSCNDFSTTLDVKNLRCSITKSRKKCQSLDDLDNYNAHPTSTPMAPTMKGPSTPKSRRKGLFYTPVYAHRLRELKVKCEDNTSLIGTPTKGPMLVLPSTPLTNPNYVPSRSITEDDNRSSISSKDSNVSGVRRIDSSHSSIEESKVELSLVADSSCTTNTSHKSKIHDTFSSGNDSKGSSLAWDNSADLLDNAHILPTDLSAHIVDHMNNDDIMDNNQAYLDIIANNGIQSSIPEVFSKEEQPISALVMTQQEQPIKDCAAIRNEEEPEIAVLNVSSKDVEQEEAFIEDSEAPRSCLAIPQTGRLASVQSSVSEISDNSNAGYYTADEI